jgi:hypothetical protein
VKELENLRIRELEWLSTDRCRASFESRAGERFDTVFTVTRGNGITSATDENDLLGRIGRSAEEARAIVHVVASFCDAAQYNPP